MTSALRNKISAILLGALACCGVALTYVHIKSAHKKSVPVGSSMAAYIHFEYAVYMMPVHRKDPEGVLRSALANEFPELRLVDELPKEPQESLVKMREEKHAQTEYAPPSIELLSFSGKGLSDQEKQTLQGAKEVFILDFAHPRKSAWTALREANEVIETLARHASTNGY